MTTDNNIPKESVENLIDRLAQMEINLMAKLGPLAPGVEWYVSGMHVAVLALQEMLRGEQAEA
jgi:hypothetical protein